MDYFYQHMGRILRFRGKCLSRLKVSIFTHAHFHEIYTVFNEVVFPFNDAERDTYTYAVLELVNNSLRAHREKNSSRPVEITFRTKSESLLIEVLDYGGGFAPSNLPYDLNQDLRTIDLHNDSFQRYRQIHNNSRFGMGLYIARRAFSGFSIGFIDGAGLVQAWGDPGIIGTRILLTLAGGSHEPG
jgi:anti-sigma regulatory factor (Ser/Thr protein kinase)